MGKSSTKTLGRLGRSILWRSTLEYGARAKPYYQEKTLAEYVSNVLYTELDSRNLRGDTFYFSGMPRARFNVNFSRICDLICAYTRLLHVLEVELTSNKYLGRDCKSKSITCRVPLLSNVSGLALTTPRVYRGQGLVLVEVNMLPGSNYSGSDEYYNSYVLALTRGGGRLY